MMTISDQLRAAIQNSGKTAYAVAKVAGVDPGVVQRFVKGERGLTLDTVDRLAAALNLELSERRQND
jgi:plasmid maintenance system antidote protein VapI